MTGRQLRAQLRMQQPCNSRVPGAAAGATDVAPAPPAATPEQAAELRAHLARIAATWTDDDRAEALAVALADPADALICFRALVADMGPAPVPAGPYTARPLAERADDDRRTCADCANLSAIGRCLAAARGHGPHGVGRSYTPIADLLGRCTGYAPSPEDPDRRPGAERWPEMVADAERHRALARAAAQGA